MKPPFYPGSKFSGIFAVLFLLFGDFPAHAKREIEGQVFIATKESQNVKLGLVPIWVIGDSEMKNLARQAVELADAVHIQAEIAAFEKNLSELENTAKKELGEESAQKVIKAAESERVATGKILKKLSAYIARGKSLLGKISRQEREIDTREISAKMLIALLAERESDADSDADGRFKLVTETTIGYLVAHGQRIVGENTAFGSSEDLGHYYWVVELPQRKSQLFLSNNNSNISESEAKLRRLAAQVGGGLGKLAAFPEISKSTPDAKLAHTGITQRVFEEELEKVDKLKMERERITAAEQAEKEKQRDAAIAEKERKLKSLADGKLQLDEAGRALLLVPGGSFQMGSREDSNAAVHSVNVSDFFMGETEVTYGEWVFVFGWARANGYSFSNTVTGSSEKHPVTNLSWHDVVKWCNAKSEKEGLMPCYKLRETPYRQGENDRVTCDWKGSGYRLPTEAEWEKAARGGLVGRKYPIGDVLSRSDANVEGIGTKQVKEYAANGYGLYDMAGNVIEWCWDWYDREYEKGVENPTGIKSGSNRVLRGGDWGGTAYFALCASRNSNSPTGSSNIYGFRLARGRLQSSEAGGR
jgi:formylglycine-generating enzyme required for sulfatase activity